MKEDVSTIGWRERLALPDLGIQRIKAKVDTGARSSSLHAFDIEVFRVHGKSRVRFKVHPSRKGEDKTVHCDEPLHDMRWVKSSNGTRELRPVIRTHVVLGSERWSIDLTLASRELMGFRMLLGREAIRDRFVIDPGRSFLVKKPAKAVRKRRRRTKVEDRNPVS
jgi:hypothetical protein